MKKLLLTTFLVSLPLLLVHAQTTIVFNVDMRAAMKDSIFIPNQDQVKIKGNLYPLSRRAGKRMTDQAPADSIYTVEVRFPRQHSGKNLTFNFEIVKPRSVLSEQGPRSILLNNEHIDLQPLGFNSFAF